MPRRNNNKKSRPSDHSKNSSEPPLPAGDAHTDPRDIPSYDPTKTRVLPSGGDGGEAAAADDSEEDLLDVYSGSVESVDSTGTMRRVGGHAEQHDDAESAVPSSELPESDHPPAVQSARSLAATANAASPLLPPGSFNSYNTARSEFQPARSDRDSSPHHQARRSRASSRASIGERMTSPAGADKRAPRPPTTRRSSSVMTHPHRGQEFSVDDEPSEVEEDWEQRQRTGPSAGPGTSGYSAGMKRRSQILRRRTTATSTLPGVDDDDEEDVSEGDTTPRGERRPASIAEPEQSDDDDEIEETRTIGARSYDEASEADSCDSMESFTLKDRQKAINETHPFGIRIWKPALYKKDRSVQRTAEGDIHAGPGGSVNPLMHVFNILWTLMFGWWMCIIISVAALSCFVFVWNHSNRQYGKVLIGLAGYVLYPFGRFVELQSDEVYAEEDEGEGRSISEYEQWQAGDIETGRMFFGPHTTRSLVGRRRESLDSGEDADSMMDAGERTGLLSGTDGDRKKRRLFGRGEWNVGRIMFYAWFYLIVAPILILVSGICWLLVFSIPMAKVSYMLFDHLRRHPLALSFHAEYNRYIERRPENHSSILLCTYRAVGWKYYKYTVDGTNIFFINLMAVVVFVIVDHYALTKALGDNAMTSPATVFTLALLSVIPLAYFIGQAVASISAQSSMGMGATINAFFSTVVEVYLYCIALTEGKSRLVEGSIVGSIFAGVVFLPGLSMCAGAIKRKTQRFNARSAGVTSTMLLFAVIAAFAPTLFYQVYGTYELSCHACVLSNPGLNDADCRKCSFAQTPPTANDKFYKEAVQPYTYLAAVFLFISYAIGLLFTLRTHAAVIWQPVAPPPTQHTVHAPIHTEGEMPNSVRGHAQTGAYDSRTPNLDRDVYKRVLRQSMNELGLQQNSTISSTATRQSLHMVPPRTAESQESDQDGQLRDQRMSPVNIASLSNEENAHLVRGVAEVAAAAATAAVQDAQRQGARKTATGNRIVSQVHPMPTVDEDATNVADALGGHGGHDAPNWSRSKSTAVLLGATVLYAVVAEILVNTVDVVLENINIDEKFLGITLFALVPNTTEFLNAISFAMNGNIALSMEIGSAYALQVCLLQIPALVAFSAFYATGLTPDKLISHTFSLIFPQWDLVTVILCVFLLSYMYGEGKSNYFKGSILLLSYLTIMIGFYFGSYAADVQNNVAQVMMGAGSKGTGYFIMPM